MSDKADAWIVRLAVIALLYVALLMAVWATKATVDLVERPCQAPQKASLF